ncbi:MAG: lysophospholipid acyltransferase family protein [Nitrospirota bacterium]
MGYSRTLSWLKLHLVPPVGALAIRLLGKTLRIQTVGTEVVDRLYRQGTNCIFAFWHSRQLMMPLAYRGTGAHVLISEHRDGELIQRIVARFGFSAVRGSTTRGGAAALRQLIRLGQSGADLVVTPDGPKGPRQVAQIGVIQLAKATGLPIVPLTFACSKKNSSRAGTGSWFPIRPDEACSCGASRSGSSPTQRLRIWKPSGSSCRKR